MNSLTRGPVFLALFAGTNLLPAQSPWLPEKGKFSVSASASFQSFDHFWDGETKFGLPDPIEQITFSLGLEAGLTKDIAFDVVGGYSQVTANMRDPLVRSLAGGQGRRDGWTDMNFGFRWRVIDEFASPEDWMPTVTLRLGGIIAGSYDTGAVNAIGDGGSGGEASLLLGKQWPRLGLGLYGTFGYRDRDNAVPAEIFGSIGAYKTFAKHWTASLAYHQQTSLSGIDVLSAQFTGADKFPALRENNSLIEVNLGYSDSAGRFYQIGLIKSLDGRNTGDKTVFTVSATLAF